MSQNFKEVVNFWQSEYSNKIKNYKEYTTKEQLHRFATFFTMGESYYYVLNMHNLELDFISDSVTDFTGIAPEDVNMLQLLQQALPEEIELIQKKERIIRDFFMNFLKPHERLEYKILYTYKMVDYKGKPRTMVMQCTTLTLTENDDLEHVFTVHTDITHLRTTKTDSLSFIHLHGGKSYYNLPLDKEVFSPPKKLDDTPFTSLFTHREKEVITAIAHGLNAKEIAENLHLSPNTVKTHRKNILAKSGCANSAELIAKSLLYNLIELDL